MNITKTLALAAAAVMASNAEAEVVHVCLDGNIFLDHAKGLAEEHCRQEKLPAPVAVTREELAGVMATGKKSKAEQAAADEKDLEDARRILAEEEARKAQDDEDAAKVLAALKDEDDDTTGAFADGVTDTERTTPEVVLKGSANQKDIIKIRKDWKLTLAQAVRHAQADSKLSADEWNALSDAERDVYIDDTVIALKETPRN